MLESQTEISYDPFSYAIHEDPFPVYAALRAECPVYHNGKWNFWAISRFTDVQTAARDWKTFSTKAGVDLDDFTALYGPGMFLNEDPPYHDVLRQVPKGYFTPNAIKELEPVVREIAQSLVTGLVEEQRGDLAKAFTHRLPVAVIMRILGFPERDLPMLQEWQADLILRNPDTNQLPEAAWDAGCNLRRYFQQMVANPSERVGHGLIDDIGAAEIDGRRLTPEEVEGMALFLWMAGNETTSSLMANSLMHLSAYPEARAALIAEPELLPQGIEELLRYDAPLQNMGRITTQAVEVEGVTIPEEQRVLLLFGSANRDERRWSDADVLDIRREPKRHLAFGEGIHFCLGAPLARLEARVAFEELLPRIPEYEITGPVERTHVHTTRGVTSLPAAW